MNKQKGFTLIELISTIVIFIVIVAGTLIIVSSFRDRVEIQEVETIVVTDPIQSDVECFEGKKIIHVNGEIYHIGKIDTWGDIKSIDCGE